MEEKTSFKVKLNKLFRELRKQKFIAKQKYWCCNTCWWGSFSDEELKQPIIFYNKQGALDIPKGYVYLSHANIKSAEADILFDIAVNDCKIQVERDGTDGETIKLIDFNS